MNLYFIIQRKNMFYSLPFELVCLIGDYLDVVNLIKFRNINKFTRLIKVKSFTDNITFYNQPSKWNTIEESPVISHLINNDILNNYKYITTSCL